MLMYRGVSTAINKCNGHKEMGASVDLEQSVEGELTYDESAAQAMKIPNTAPRPL